MLRALGSTHIPEKGQRLPSDHATRLPLEGRPGPPGTPSWHLPLWGVHPVPSTVWGVQHLYALPDHRSLGSRWRLSHSLARSPAHRGCCGLNSADCRTHTSHLLLRGRGAAQSPRKTPAVATSCSSSAHGLLVPAQGRAPGDGPGRAHNLPGSESRAAAQKPSPRTAPPTAQGTPGAATHPSALPAPSQREACSLPASPCTRLWGLTVTVPGHHPRGSSFQGHRVQSAESGHHEEEVLLLSEGAGWV